MKNAVSAEQPCYFLTNKNAIVRNSSNQFAQIKDVMSSRAFRPQNCNYSPGKEMKPTMRYGLSKDSPFHTVYTKHHPSTKQLQDYDEKQNVGS